MSLFARANPSHDRVAELRAAYERAIHLCFHTSWDAQGRIVGICRKPLHHAGKHKRSAL